MYINKKDLCSHLDKPGLRNFFRTFGFFVIKEYYDPDGFSICQKAYKDLYELKYGRPWEDLMSDRPGQMFQPNFLDSSHILLENVITDSLIEIVKYLLGDDYIYLGSDGSCFVETSFHWHRDWFTAIPQLKINSYFNNVDYSGGRFLVIPGSHNISDFYTHCIGEGLGWPFGNTQTGGLNERGYFPFMPSPRERFSAPIEEFSFQTPHQALELGERDIVVFDQRMLHCVEEVQPVSPRMLCTALFTSSPHAICQDPFYAEYLKTASSLHDREVNAEAMKSELETLFWAERDQIGCPAYGPYIGLNHRLYPDHLACDITEVGSLFPFSTESIDSEILKHVDPNQHPTYKRELETIASSNSLYRPLNLSLNLYNTSPTGRR